MSLLLAIAVIAFFVILILRHHRRRNFDMTPRDRHGDAITDDPDDDQSSDDEDDNEEDPDQDPSQAPIYDDDNTYEDWHQWQELLQEVGIIDIRDGMIEYETGDNSRLFIMLAEMGQSNPYLKTDEELARANAIQEVFFNGVMSPLKMSSQSQRIEMTDFLKSLKEHSQFMHGSNKQMKQYAKHVIDNTLSYQEASDRFENKAYLQFQAVVKPDEVFGDSPMMLERQIHEKASEKLLRQIDRADGLLRRADHSLAPLDTFGLLEVLYRTFNRETSVKIRLEDIVKKQRYSLFTTAHQNDTMFKEVQMRIHAETEAINDAREAQLATAESRKKAKLAKGEEYYSGNEDLNQASSTETTDDDLFKGIDDNDDLDKL